MIQNKSTMLKVFTATLEKILEVLPNQTTQTISGKPSYEAISELHLKFNTNVVSVSSHKGNMLLGLLYIAIYPEVYNTQPEIVFMPPLNPGQHPNIPERST